MKFIAGLLVVLSSASASASSAKIYECQPSGSNVRYEDTFRVELYENGLSQLLYKRVIHYRGSVIETPFETIRGCGRAKWSVEADRYYDMEIECENDGEEGSVSLNTGSMIGEIYFYQPQIGYPERTGLKVSCRLGS